FVGGHREKGAVHPAAERNHHGPHLPEDPVELEGLRAQRLRHGVGHSSQSSSEGAARSSSSGDRPTTSSSTPHSGQLMISPLSTSYSSISMSASQSGQTAIPQVLLALFVPMIT